MHTQVILFTGFLESGKTSLLLEALREDPWCDEQPLIILCEEGETELPRKYHPIVTIEDENQLRADFLDDLDRQFRPTVVFLEHNGMWLTNTLTTHLPANWQITGSYLTADAESFPAYLLNLRSLTIDKLDISQYILFNRCTPETDRQQLHDLVRRVNLSARISFEYLDGSLVFDELPVQIPYDLTAPVVEIPDQAFALFYRDISQNLPAYTGKILRFKGQIRDVYPGGLLLGRMVMVCCEQDMSCAALSCRWTGYAVEGSWVQVTAQVELSDIEKNTAPCLLIQRLVPVSPPDPEIATYQ